jgi:hypothetical protein
VSIKAGELHTGQFLDTIIDVASIGYDAYRLVKDGKKDLKTNLAALGADTGAAFIPFATGAGVAVRGASKADDIGKAASKVSEAKKTSRGVGGSGEPRIHVKQHSSRKKAKDAARQAGDGAPEHDAAGKGQAAHFHATRKGKRVKSGREGGVHHSYGKKKGNRDDDDD